MSSDSRKVADYLNHSVDPTTKVPSSMLVSADNVGVEVELENMNPAIEYNRIKYWSVTTDRSLRDNGLEFVFRQPLGGVDVINAVNELEDFINRNKIKVQLSERTSVHVHLDVRDLSIDEMFNLIVAYAFVERVMMRYCGEERMKNNFCIPLYEIGSATFLNRISAMQNSNTFQHAANQFTETERYSAFNLNSLLSYGSIEFRGYHGTYHAPELFAWINVILSLKKFARETSPAFCREFHTNISKYGIDHVFNMIFRPDIARYLSTAYTREDLVACIPVVQDLIILSDVINTAEKQLKNIKANDNPLIKRLMYVHNKPLYQEVYGTVGDEKPKGGVEIKRALNPFSPDNPTLNDIMRIQAAFAEADVRLRPGAVIAPTTTTVRPERRARPVPPEARPRRAPTVGVADGDTPDPAPAPAGRPTRNRLV